MDRSRHITMVLGALATLTLVALPLWADVVVLQNGESLSGTFSRIRDNTLVFRTSLQGQMMTPMRDVQTLSTEAMLYIEMKDGQVHYGRLGTVEGAQHVFPIGGGAPVAIDAAAIVRTLPIPASGATTDDDGTDWEIAIGPGVQWRSDGDAPVEPVLRLDITGRGARWRVEGDAVVERADPDDFPAYLRAESTLFSDTDALLSPYVSAGIERDLDRSLELRHQLGVGLYRELYAGATSSITGRAGVDVEYERRSAPRHRAFQRDSRQSTHDLNLRLGLRYYRLFARHHTLSESLTLFPALTDPGAFRARSETVYALPITDRLRLRFDVTVDYESDPLFGGMSRWNASVGAGVNVVF